MSGFDLSRKIKFEKQVDAQAIKELIMQHLSKTCVFEVVSDRDESFSVAGRVKETLFTPVVKYTASFLIKIEGDKARINVNGSSSPFWGFWVVFALGFVTAGVCTAIAIGLFVIQKNRPRDTCESILNAIETEFGSL
jgi:hypothetical protein